VGGSIEVPATVRLHRRGACPGRSHRYYRRITVIEVSGQRHRYWMPCPY
jgi:hypothetical protein